MKIELVEYKGMYVDGKEILLGSNIEAAKEILGAWDVYESNYYFMDAFVSFTVDADKRIMAMEVSNTHDIEVNFRNLEIFKVEKKDLLHYMSNFNKGSLPHDEDIYSYRADNLGVTFRFGATEEDIEDMIREAKRDGVYEEMKEDIEKDIYRSKYIDSFLIQHENFDEFLLHYDMEI